jgi:hypothetical protein
MKMAEMDEVKDMSGIEVTKGIMTGMKKGVRKENKAFQPDAWVLLFREGADLQRRFFP